ncbi:hypothetical protein FVE85_3016 [Porphyridium purpureum]|uniref:Uncharacterized protein n=1 Tax=Porphyridium purpureum TaxID=35688 RepID=A0A5J4YU52_PORPP|nr:hypothetical protein FVE85_3016 [Porphyridium purpureum]|eukprot:POR8766..scf227_4
MVSSAKKQAQKQRQGGRGQVADFAKKKRKKLGRADAQLAANATRTDLRVRRVYLPEQSVKEKEKGHVVPLERRHGDVPDGEDSHLEYVSKLDAELQDALSRVSHYAPDTRRDALVRIRRVFRALDVELSNTQNHRGALARLTPVFDVALQCLLDNVAHVRTASLELLFYLLSRAELRAASRANVNMFTARISAALAHISPEVRWSACEVLAVKEGAQLCIQAAGYVSLLASMKELLSAQGISISRRTSVLRALHCVIECQYELQAGAPASVDLPPSEAGKCQDEPYMYRETPWLDMLALGSATNRHEQHSFTEFSVELVDALAATWNECAYTRELLYRGGEFHSDAKQTATLEVLHLIAVMVHNLVRISVLADHGGSALSHLRSRLLTLFVNPRHGLALAISQSFRKSQALFGLNAPNLRLWLQTVDTITSSSILLANRISSDDVRQDAAAARALVQSCFLFLTDQIADDASVLSNSFHTLSSLLVGFVEHAERSSGLVSEPSLSVYGGWADLLDVDSALAHWLTSWAQSDAIADDIGVLFNPTELQLVEYAIALHGRSTTLRLSMQVIEKVVLSIPRKMYELARAGARDSDISVHIKLARILKNAVVRLFETALRTQSYPVLLNKLALRLKPFLTDPSVSTRQRNTLGAPDHAATSCKALARLDALSVAHLLSTIHYTVPFASQKAQDLFSDFPAIMSSAPESIARIMCRTVSESVSRFALNRNYEKICSEEHRVWMLGLSFSCAIKMVQSSPHDSVCVAAWSALVEMRQFVGFSTTWSILQSHIQHADTADSLMRSLILLSAVFEERPSPFSAKADETETAQLHSSAVQECMSRLCSNVALLEEVRAQDRYTSSCSDRQLLVRKRHEVLQLLSVQAK